MDILDVFIVIIGVIVWIVSVISKTVKSNKRNAPPKAHPKARNDEVDLMKRLQNEINRQVQAARARQDGAEPAPVRPLTPQAPPPPRPMTPQPPTPARSKQTPPRPAAQPVQTPRPASTATVKAAPLAPLAPLAPPCPVEPKRHDRDAYEVECPRRLRRLQFNPRTMTEAFVMSEIWQAPVSMRSRNPWDRA